MIANQYAEAEDSDAEEETRLNVDAIPATTDYGQVVFEGSQLSALALSLNTTEPPMVVESESSSEVQILDEAPLNFKTPVSKKKTARLEEVLDESFSGRSRRLLEKKGWVQISS